jgi:AsmA-like protein
MNKLRVIRWIALLSGVFLVALVALVLTLPILVDSEAVKSKAQAFIAEKTNGSAGIEKIELFWFPRPGVVIRDAAISFDKEIHGNIQQLRLFPSIRRLLTGNLAFSSITADGAAWIVRLPARDDEPFDLDELEEKVRRVVRKIGLGFPGMNLRVRRGMVDIGIAGRPSLSITEVDASLGATPDRLDFKISGRSNVADRIRFAGEIATASLAMAAEVEIENAGLRKAVDLFSPGSIGWVEDGATTLDVKLRTTGLKNINAEISGSLPSLTLARGNRKALIEAKNFKVAFTGDEKAFHVAIEHMPLVSPPLNAAGELNFDRLSAACSVKLTGRDIDAGMIRKTALLLADDVPAVRDLFRYLQSGTIAEIHVETRGRSFAEAIESKDGVVTANLRGLKIVVPGPDLDLENVAGSLLISAGVLECNQCSATLGKAKGRDGALRMGLTGPSRPFHLDIMVESDAREAQSLLVRHVKDDAIRKEVSRIRHVDGSLAGRLILGGTLDAISVKVSAVQAALTASYEPVLYPIALKGGRFNYDNGMIEAESLTGAIGRSSFAGLKGSVRTDGKGQLNIKSARLQLDLEQAEHLFRKLETVQAKLGPESSARGKIDFVSLSLVGPLDDPNRWEFTGRGKVAGVLIKHPQLPAPVAISHGAFDATHEKLTFADAQVELLDASMTGGGVIDNWRKAPLRIEATASGIIGGRLMEWVRRQTEMPADFMPRSPLEFSAGRVAWRDDGDFSFNGKLTVAHGPRLFIDMARNPRSFTIKDLSIDDAGQSARATFDLASDNWGFAFNGTLNKRTLDRMFLTPPMPIGLLQGDFAVNTNRQPPFRLSARGSLAGKDVVLPLKGEDAVIEQIVVQGEQAGLNIRSADLRWRRSRISAAGKLTAAKDALNVDMDLAADRLVWGEFSDVFGRGDRQRDKTNGTVQMPALEGVIRLKADSFAFGTWFLNPLQITVSLTPNGMSGEVENSVVCGIRTAGRFAVRNNDEMELDVRLSVRDGDLDSTSRCLSFEKSDISGTYSLDGRLRGGGSRERLARTLSGGFDFVARDGKFIRAASVDATFDYLNHTGDFDVAFPDLQKEAYPYQFIRAKGVVERQSIFAKELIIEASPYAIMVEAKADLEQRTIDAKGLVTVLLPADKVIKSIPLVGSILSGSIVGIPVEIAGPLEQPRVSYLSPAALGTELLNIPLRIIKAPWDSLQIFTPR